MKKLLLILLIFPSLLIAQKTAIIKGTVKNKNNQPIEKVSVKFGKTGTSTDEKGRYSIRIPVKQTISLVFSHVSYHTLSKEFTSKSIKTTRYSPILRLKTEQLEEIIVKDKRNEAEGITTIDTKKVQNLIGPNAGVENVLMTLPGVNNNNELSTQYNVRGGNFDENLVYVNGIEIYRPFLVRSGQQEGLSFINSHMIQNIKFSAGGFQAKYGDKLSSVLDITYRKPKELKTTIDASLLGASITVEKAFNEKLSGIIGVRYRDNSLFVNSKQVEVNFNPNFTDVQSFLSYDYSDKLTISYLGNFSLNNYNYKPLSRKTRFGTVADPLELIVFYSGQEKDAYLTLFNAVSAEYKVNEDLTLTGVASIYNTQEEEHFDIAAAYNLGEVDTNVASENFGEVEFSEGIGSQINHARNDLDALITNLQIRGTLKKGKNQYDFGVKYQNENIKDRIREWEIIDSLGFAVRPPNHTTANNQPYSSFNGPIEPFQNIRVENNVQTNRISGFAQFSRKDNWNEHDVWYNFGIRAQRWNVASNGVSQSHFIFSPRAQFAIKPDWEKDMLFRISGGWYSQPPFYKELRDINGVIHPEVKAQKSFHLVAGNDYSFNMWERPFKLTTALFYKNLSDVNSYTVDNVRIRYRADNVTEAYAYGLDVRLNGEFVPGSDSWVSIGYLKTEENIDNRGYIARPSDQRFKLGILFQDYVPNIPDLKAYLNLVYNTGVPGGSPAYADVYQFQERLRDYKRADIGISYVFADINKQHTTGWLSKFKELTAGLELFNMFDIQNSITNTWVRDVYSKRQYGIPNFMTGRVLNFKVSMQF
ncbi:outer membrane receptor protein involved in Fe transport [Lutibacter sp. Hel_I_33_5]|uniref:TonB-dependent receptor n=1 Tax=Lutibacter sp. Hel_I_33_5 TaxID=1566289 RepID=UPI0011A6CCF0|nr:TonB-dependent receptor [Lutibacter sp. Hel_I_33_5]TVZ54837.1 outer membrane receptor protein involved in Fe transport [Lutibacter sp. Hel_I_33_5]